MSVPDSYHYEEWKREFDQYLWANPTRNFNFKQPNDLDAAAFNRVLWRGMMGEDRPYPVDRGKNAVVY